jgi:indolepyruvate ferredoxin oxidoreductase alpha subunit
VLHVKLLEKYEKARELSNQSGFNRIIGQGKWGIITSGVSFNYVSDALADLKVQDKFSVLRIGFSYPLPNQIILNFLKGKEKVLIAEELEPYLEEGVKALAQEAGITIPIKGKGPDLFSRLFEYDPGLVRQVIARYFGLPYEAPLPAELKDIPPLPQRPPNLCPGCPHRMTFYAVKKVTGNEAIYPTDIGCYTLGLLPPLQMADYLICMGSSVTTAAGFARATGKPVIAFIGDSTFFHGGITGLVNAVHNNHKFTLVILDNGTTAMTGHQPNPGVDMARLGQPQTTIKIEDLVRGIGVRHVVRISPKNVKKMEQAVQEALDFDGVSVIISDEICPLYAKRFPSKVSPRTFTVNPNKCKKHRNCINDFACPAFYLEGEEVRIDENLCIGCAVCAQVCHEGAIVLRK